MQAINAARPGGHVGFVGVSHDVTIPGDELFFSEVHLLGGPAPVRGFLPELIKLIWDRKIEPGKVFDRTPRSTRRPTDTRRWTNAAQPRCS
jgi:threonine dehydrogenase-like Zn-dependent dehydrogenase